MREYKKEEKMKLVKKTHTNRKNGLDQFAGFSTEEKLVTVLFQLEILNPNLSVYRELNSLANKLIRDLLIEQMETTTNKGMRKVVDIKGSSATICKKCNGTGINHQLKDNKCDCIRGWFYDNKLKLISEAEYKERATKKYFKNLKKKNLVSRYTKEELLNLNINEFLDITKVTTV